MLTPIDIHNREFKKGLRGYKESEVDEFLDRVVADYEKLWRENERLKEQARFNEKEINHYRNLERNLQDTLVVAQKTADEVVSAAKKNAKEMRENAVRESKTMYDNTVRETQNMREQTQIDIKRQLDDAQQKLRVIVAEYNRLVTDKEAFFIRVRTTLESELAITNQLLHSLPPSEDFGKIQSSIFDAFEQDIKSQALVDAALKSPEPVEEEEEEVDEVKIVDAIKEVDVTDDNTKVVPKSGNSNLRNSDKVSKIEQALKSAKAASQAKLEAELEKTTTYTPTKKS
ncbi:MAG: DivIVA domain-containing protein [Selenomonadaceae bacterium]|nr:DivIVA domain-containing protein [Selenomonadaceae bacterium]